jgi:flagellar biosynthesis protein FlhF
MKIKKYLVKSIDEALAQIKRDLGGDAYILSQKKVVQTGALQLGHSEMIEITAAIDKSEDPGSGDFSQALLAKKYAPSAPRPKAAAGDAQAAIPDLSELKQELLPLRHEVENLRLLIKRSHSDLEPKTLEFKGLFLELYLNLIDNGLEIAIARKLIQTLQVQGNDQWQSDYTQLKRRLFQLLVSTIALPEPIRLTPGQRRVVSMVGPTGVGKTTTIAKLASYFRLKAEKKVALLTIDSFRIGAAGHLKTYADILGVPFYTVNHPREMSLRLQRLADFDVIFVDTTGRSARDSEGIAGMAPFLAAVPAPEREVILLLSACYKSQDCKHILSQFGPLGPSKFIFTKIDETLSLGNLASVKLQSELPIAYLTSGQRVPEDIEVAQPQKFARLVLEGHHRSEQ